MEPIRQSASPRPRDGETSEQVAHESQRLRVPCLEEFVSHATLLPLKLLIIVTTGEILYNEQTNILHCSSLSVVRFILQTNKLHCTTYDP